MIKKFRIKINGKEYKVEVEEEVLEEGGIAGGDKSRKILERKETKEIVEENKEEGKIIYAPMPAKVIKVACRAGDRVRKGDILIILEAMKMENEIISPFDGVIKEVRAIEGMSISHNEAMVVFE